MYSWISHQRTSKLSNFLNPNSGPSFSDTSRKFSHVTKSCIFKNLNLKKSWSQLSQQFPAKPFQAPKITFKSPKLIGQKLLSYGDLLKDKRLKFTFFERKFSAKEDLNSRKQVFLFNLKVWPTQKLKICSIFYDKKFIKENSVVWSLGAFGLKISTFLCLLVAAISLAYLAAFTMA